MDKTISYNNLCELPYINNMKIHFMKKINYYEQY